MTPRLVSCALLFFACAVAVSCDGKNNGGDSATTGGSIVIGLLSEPSSLNPIVATSSREQQIINLLFLKLMKEGADFVSFNPALAESWSVSEDGLAITFALRDGVLWHDGAPVTVHDVAFTFALQTNADAAWAGRHSKDRIDRVEVLDERRVVFHFKSRYPHQLMDANDGPILPKHLLEGVAPDQIRASAFGRAPVGNGPYRLAEWSSAQHVRLIRNETHYDADLPRLDEVIFRFIPDETAMMTALKAGDIHCVGFLSPEATTDAEFSDGTLRAHQYLGRQMGFVAWNTSRAPFDNRELRRALAHGIDADAVIRVAWNGLAQPSDSPMHPVLWPHDPGMKPIAYNPAAARDALAALGWTDSDGDGVVDRGGEPLAFEMLTNQGAQQRIDAITILQSQLREVGVDVKLRVLEMGAFMQAVIREGDFDACLFAYNVATRADLKNYWSTGATFNLSRYSNAEVDALIDKARSMPGMDEARPLWHEAQHRIYEDQPHYFLVLPYELMGVSSRYCNVAPGVQGPFFDLPEWYIGEDCP